MVASEMRPFATSGGLSEVVQSLPAALEQLGHTVTVILPRYRRADRVVAFEGDSADGKALTARTDGGARLELGGAAYDVRFHRTPVGTQSQVVFVDVPALFDREGLYGDAAGDYDDNAVRFAVFSRAALEYVRLRGRRPSVLHLHDWQTGLVPAYQKMLFSPDPIVGGVPAVFTIHNLAFQGLFPASTLDRIGLPHDVLHVNAMEYHGGISYLKSGINFSERITTVSPSYASEILEPESGFGFDGILRRRADDLTGILNGIDATRWDPQHDAFIPQPYSASDLEGKAGSKRALLEESGLPLQAEALARPLIGMVSRLTGQKGLDLVAAALDRLLAFDASWVLLGSGDARFEELLRALPSAHPGRVSVTIGYDERLEHLITAGADLFLMPSRFEPCGLNQLNSLRYGTIPVVRATGGLRDTVQDDRGGGEGTGFVFHDYTPDALVDAVARALAAYREPERWRTMQRTAMSRDYSWDLSAREYVKVYGANL